MTRSSANALLVFAVWAALSQPAATANDAAPLFLGKYTAKDVLRAVFPRAEVVKMRDGLNDKGWFRPQPEEKGNADNEGFLIRAWPRVENSLLFIESAQDETDSDKRVHKIHMLWVDGQRLMTSNPVSVRDEDILEEYKCPMVAVGEVSFDFAPYEIMQNHFAFGVRFDAAGRDAGGAEFGNTLVLFRWNKQSLNRIFKARTSYRFVPTSEDETAPPPEERVVVMSKKESNGFRDILLKQKDSKDVVVFHWNQEDQSYSSSLP